MQTFDGSRRLFGRAGPQLRCSLMLILAVRRQFLNSERVSRRFVDLCVSRRILAASVRRRRVAVEGGVSAAASVVRGKLCGMLVGGLG